MEEEKTITITFTPEEYKLLIYAIDIAQENTIDNELAEEYRLLLMKVMTGQ